MNQYAKAVAAALGAFSPGFLLATRLDSAGGESVTANEWVLLAVTTLLAAALTWAVPNTPNHP